MICDPNKPCMHVSCLFTGVGDVVTNVEEKSVVVTCEGLTAEELASKLEKVSVVSPEV